MAVSEDVQNCADEESMEEWDSQRIQSAWRDARIARIYEGTNKSTNAICRDVDQKKQ
jgi:hypothetical protein